MNALGVILIVLGVVLVALFVGGYVVNTRRRRDERAALLAQAEQADHALAEAHAEDKGWERSGLESAARAAYEARSPGAPLERLTLVQVIDRPGTEEDEAVFDADGERVVLCRSGDDWVAR